MNVEHITKNRVRKSCKSIKNLTSANRERIKKFLEKKLC